MKAAKILLEDRLKMKWVRVPILEGQSDDSFGVLPIPNKNKVANRLKQNSVF